MQDSPARGYRFRDLIDLRIVSSRSDLHRKQKEAGFPRPAKFGDKQAWFPAPEVHRWVNERIAARDRAVTKSQPENKVGALLGLQPKKPKPVQPVKRGRQRKLVASELQT